MSLIEIRNLSKNYKNKSELEVKALDNVSLNIENGDFIAVCGVSGSGKSTLLNMIGCMDKPTTGSIVIDDMDITRLKDSKRSELRNQKIGFVMQDFGLISYRNVYENVMVPLYFSNTTLTKSKEKVMSALESVGMDKFAKRKVTSLSGGQKQRVAIARALVNNPEILLADEPTGALDSTTKMEILSLFKSIHEAGKTIIMVTHDESMACGAKRILHMSDGKLS